MLVPKDFRLWSLQTTINDAIHSHVLDRVGNERDAHPDGDEAERRRNPRSLLAEAGVEAGCPASCNRLIVDATPRWPNGG